MFTLFMELIIEIPYPPGVGYLYITERRRMSRPSRICGESVNLDEEIAGLVSEEIKVLLMPKDQPDKVCCRTGEYRPRSSMN